MALDSYQQCDLKEGGGDLELGRKQAHYMNLGESKLIVVLNEYSNTRKSHQESNNTQQT